MTAPDLTALAARLRAQADLLERTKRADLDRQQQAVFALERAAAEALGAASQRAAEHDAALLELSLLKTWLEDCGESERAIDCVIRHMQRARAKALEQSRRRLEALERFSADDFRIRHRSVVLTDQLEAAFKEPT
jgi:hypothetical protein